MPKLDVFVAPQPWPAFAKAMSWVNRILMLHGMPLMRDIPGLRRVPGVRGLSDIRQIHLPAADLEKLKAVCESSPFASTARAISIGLASTSLWLAQEPMADTIPSPTLAIIVSSVAPPISCLMLVRTVTRAFAFN